MSDFGMNTDKKALETIRVAFYSIADLAEDNMPDEADAPGIDGWATYHASMESFKSAFKELAEGPQPKTLNEKLIEFYKSHPDSFADDLEAFDRLNCYYFLGNERRRPMAQLDDLLGYKSVAELLTLGGHSSNEDGGPFDWHCAYFYIGNDGVGSDGHLVSTNARDYRVKFLCDGMASYTVAKIIENAARLHLSHGAQRVIDESEEKR